MKAKILLVDDYSSIRDALGRTLRLEGYEVTVASNGQEALICLRDTAFDLVLLDLDMPVMNGWDALRQMVAINGYLPVIIITERSDQQGLAAQKGVAAVLEKPLEVRLVLEVIERALAEAAEARRDHLISTRKVLSESKSSLTK